MRNSSSSSKYYEITIFGFIIELNLAEPNTCWWSNDRDPRHTMRIREDKLFTISRVYSRTLRFYVYRIIVGRIKLEAFHIPKTNHRK